MITPPVNDVFLEVTTNHYIQLNKSFYSSHQRVCTSNTQLFSCVIMYYNK